MQSPVYPPFARSSARANQAAAVPGGTMPQLVPAPTSGVAHHGTGHYQNQIHGSASIDMASVSYTQNTQRSNPAMPLAVRIAFFIAQYAQYSDMIEYYHQESAELERMRLYELRTSTDFLASLSTNKSYDAQHHQLIDEMEGCFEHRSNSGAYSSCNPGLMQGDMHQQTSSTVTQLSASQDLQQQGQNAPYDVGTAQGFQAMPPMPYSTNTPAPVQQQGQNAPYHVSSDQGFQAMPAMPYPAIASAPVPQNHPLGPLFNDAQDINLGPLTKADTEARDINELDTRILMHWYEKNYNFAYPLPQTTDILVKATGLQKWQVDKWFNNRRSRDKNTKKFDDIKRVRKERVKKGSAWLKEQDDQLKKDIIQIKAKYNKVR